MDEPEKWIGGRRNLPMAARVAHARARYRWHCHLWRQARDRGDKAAMERQRIRMNSARRYWSDLMFEQRFRSKL